jgi:hypothetical protein
MDLVGSGRLEPARSNLYGVEIAIPPVLAANDDNVRRNQRNHYDYVNALADDVTIPGRRITTGQVRSVGAMRRFATDTSFSEMSVSFLLPKDLYHRDMFEKWMNYTASDAENRVTFYSEYTTTVRIKKWEVGSPIVYQGRTNEGDLYSQRLNRVTGVWDLYGAFPFDMSAINVSTMRGIDLILLQMMSCPIPMHHRIRLSIHLMQQQKHLDSLHNRQMSRSLVSK